VSASRQRGGIAPGSRTHVQNPARVRGDGPQHVAVDFVKDDFLVLNGERIRRLGIPGGSPVAETDRPRLELGDHTRPKATGTALLTAVKSSTRSEPHSLRSDHPQFLGPPPPQRLPYELVTSPKVTSEGILCHHPATPHTLLPAMWV
jgi:hypothetical protein